LYDAPGYGWPKQNLLSLMNGGIHIFNHLGHANYTYCMKLYTADLASLTNTDYFFVYSQGCMPGGFDTPECFAEVLTSMEQGAFAAIMNARYGWGMYDSTDGPSHRFARQFWDAVLNEDEDKLEMGRANQDSKEDNLWGITGECIRWCYYELNLFGDPEQQFWFGQGQTLPPWLEITPEQGTIGPKSSTNVDLDFKACAKRVGTHRGIVTITFDDIYNTVINVPVTLEVTE
jgi:hypothetical protein